MIKTKRISTLFLRGVLLLTAIVALAAMIRFPQTEGRAADLNLIRIYTDPFILYGYVASIPFYTALFQAFRLLGYVDSKQIFSRAAVRAVRIIKYCSITFSGLIVSGIVVIRLFAHGDDAAGPTAFGILAAFASIVIATGADIFAGILQDGADVKSKNDLVA